MNRIEFFVPGLCQTAGSKRAFPIARKGPNGQRVFTGRNIVVDANPRSKDWRARVAHEAELAMDLPVNRRGLIEGAVEVSFRFQMPRIGAHFNSAGLLKSGAPLRPTVRPDALKLARAIEDAITGVVWKDDSQIVLEHLEKVYSEKPGCLVTITEIENAAPAERKPEAMELKLEGAV